LRCGGCERHEPWFGGKNGRFPWVLSPGGHLAYADFPSVGRGGDIWTVPITADASGVRAGTPEEFLRTTANELFPAFSPDGRWIAYRTDVESGTSEIEVRAFPNTGGK